MSIKFFGYINWRENEEKGRRDKKESSSCVLTK